MHSFVGKAFPLCKKDVIVHKYSSVVLKKVLWKISTKLKRLFIYFVFSVSPDAIVK